jgi:ribosomal protein S18 acetylase RimI-like enzyme
MASIIAERALPNLQVVDLTEVRPRELKALWEREVRLWREELDWDVSGAMSALSRAVDRGGLTGKAIRCGGVTAAYGYYVVEGDRGVISGLVVAPSFRGRLMGSAIVDAIVDELDRRRVRRIETQFICFDAPWLVSCFEERGFETHWREFLRASVSRPRPQRDAASQVVVLPWSAWNLSEMAALMQRAHAGGVDAAMNELYRTPDGCRVLLNNIIRQRGCGRSLTEASSIARERATDVPAGFAIVTEIGRRHGHLAQVAVAPAFQGTGVGHRLLTHTFTRLAELGLDTLSLMASRGNERALGLYRTMGFHTTFQFPVFSRELSGGSAR